MLWNSKVSQIHLTNTWIGLVLHQQDLLPLDFLDRFFYLFKNLENMFFHHILLVGPNLHLTLVHLHIYMLVTIFWVFVMWQFVRNNNCLVKCNKCKILNPVCLYEFKLHYNIVLKNITVFSRIKQLFEHNTCFEPKI